MTLYNLVLFAHIASTLALFMAIAVESICLLRMRGATTTGQLREWATLIKLTDRALPLSTVGILATGLYMALSGWGLGVAWVGLSLGVVIVMSVVGPRVNSRRLSGIAAAAEAEPPGPIPVELLRRIHDPILLASVQILTALGFGVVFLKAVKPDLPGSLAALGVAVALGLLSAQWVSRGDEMPAGASPSPAEAAGDSSVGLS